MLATFYQSRFSPRSLFAAGEQGGWYDPSDFSSMSQDSAGTTPVTAVGQPVGLILDKRLGMTLGSELVANNNFASGGTSWTPGAGWSISGGVATATASSANLISATFATVAGKWYEATWVVNAASAGQVQCLVWNLASNYITSQFATAAGTYKQRFLANNTTTQIYLAASSFTGVVGSMSTKLLDGNHLIQATAAARPVLQQDGSGFYYLSFDGVDDGLASAATVNFSATDKMTVFAGVVRGADTVNMAILNLGDILGAATGGFLLRHGTSGGVYQGVLVGTTLSSVFSAASAGASAVLTHGMDIGAAAGAEDFIRLNGAAALYSAQDAGTGNFGTSVVHLGKYQGTTNPFIGRVYQAIIRGATSNATQITSAERFVGSKMGIAL